MNLAQQALAKINEAKTGKKINENVAGEISPGYPVGTQVDTVTLELPALAAVFAMYDSTEGEGKIENLLDKLLALSTKIGRPINNQDLAILGAV
jgi:hypothetical protein